MSTQAPNDGQPVVVPEDQMQDIPEDEQADAEAQYEQDVPPAGEQVDVPSTDLDVARLAREERMRLLPEYLEHFFLEDLPPLNPDDPFNQGIYMRYRINQVRDAKGKEPVE